MKDSNERAGKSAAVATLSSSSDRNNINTNKWSPPPKNLQDEDGDHDGDDDSANNYSDRNQSREIIKMQSLPTRKKHHANATSSDTSSEMKPVYNGDSRTAQVEGDEFHSVVDSEYVDIGMSRRSFMSVNVNSSSYEQLFSFGWFDITVCICSIILFFVDVGTDVNLAVTYFKNSKWLWGIETTVIVVVPSIIVCCLGLHWYIIDYHKEKQKQRQTSSRCIWFVRIVFTLLQCGPVLR